MRNHTEDERGYLSQRNILLGVVFLLAAIFSFTVVAKVAVSPCVISGTVGSLDQKRKTVGEISAAAAATSVLIAAVPDDATTPIADQISNVCSYLLIVVGAIMFEKYLISITGLLAFKIMIPIGCLCLGGFWFMKKKLFLKYGIRLILVGFVFYLLIPLSVVAGDYIDETFHTAQTVEDVKDVAEEIQEFSNGAESDAKKSILDILSDLGSTVIDKFTGAIDYLEQVVDRFMDAVAAMIVTSCIIPLAVLWLLIHAAKYVIGLSRDVLR